MQKVAQRRTAACMCGQTTIQLTGEPILSAICCCASCRTAGRDFERVPGAPSVVRADGGTEYCLYRKDRLKIVQGAEHLREYRITAESATRRVIAQCCTTPMFLDFTKGHWLTLYRDRLDADRPQLQMRIMAKDAPDGVRFTDAVPSYPKHPPVFMVKLLTAWIAMGFRRPKLQW